MPDTTHAFVSQVADDADSSTISPSNWNAAHPVSILAGASVTELGSTISSAGSLTVAGNLTVADPPLGFVGSFRIGTQTIRTDQYLLAWKSLTMNDGTSLTVEQGGDVTIFDLPSVGGQLTISGRA